MEKKATAIDKKSTRQAYSDALVSIGVNRNIVVMDADMSKHTMTYDFSQKYPDRFFNAGIAEANMMSVAAGLASAGKTVFVSTLAVFAAGRAYEQIRCSICYPKLNVKVCATHGGIAIGEDGASHQMIEDIALMRVIPNMCVISPADYYEAKASVEFVASVDGPFYVRLGRLAMPTIFDEDYKFKFGRGIELRKGKDITIIATGLMTAQALEAANLLEQKNISARVINIHTIKPIDIDIIVKAARETRAIVTAEEHSVIGGLGGAVAEVTAAYAPVRMGFVGMSDTFGRSGKPVDLFKFYGLTAENIVNTVYKLLNN
ncbi:MAG: transketolase family protein [Oscillospiraceae bacterium]|jgi:transketolase|nr:transketolase family protein [Oscillospiraceae bacterium]